MNTTPARKRATLKIVLAGVAIVGVGAAVTTAVWTDDVFFGATATASSFDLQHAASATGPWSDDGVPGDEAVVTITAAGLDTLSPSTTVDVPFYLCNVGTAAGTITDITDPVIVWPLATAAGATVTATVTTPARRCRAVPPTRRARRPSWARCGRDDGGLPAGGARHERDDHVHGDRHLQLSGRSTRTR